MLKIALPKPKSHTTFEDYPCQSMSKTLPSIKSTQNSRRLLKFRQIWSRCNLPTTAKYIPRSLLEIEPKQAKTSKIST